MFQRIFLVLFLFVSLGCGLAPSSQPGSSDASGARLHFLALNDISSSMDGRVPRLNPSELEPLLDYAQEHGGTIAFGTFGVTSRPLSRAVFDPETTDAQVNVFLRQADGQTSKQDYQTLCANERERFLGEVGESLQESANYTNLVAGLMRAEIFFEEVRDARHVLLIISDLQDTTGIEDFTLRLDPSVRLLLVADSVRNLGLLEEQADQFEHFESVPAAIRTVLRKE